MVDDPVTRPTKSGSAGASRATTVEGAASSGAAHSRVGTAASGSRLGTAASSAAVSRVGTAEVEKAAASSRPTSRLMDLLSKVKRMESVVSRGTPSGGSAAGLAGATPPPSAPPPPPVPEVAEPESEPEGSPVRRAKAPSPRKARGRRTPRKIPAAEEDPVEWVDALGKLEDSSKTPRAWAESDPLSVGVVRKHFRLRRKSEEAARLSRTRRNADLKAKYVTGDVPSDDDDGAAAATGPPAVVDDVDALRIGGLSYAAIVDGAGPARDAAVADAEARLMGGAAVLLVASPDDNDGDASACRLVLRTLHAALNPKLVDPIPPPPVLRADGTFAVRLDAKAPRSSRPGDVPRLDFPSTVLF